MARFREADSNEDGFVSRDEMLAHATALVEQRKQEPSGNRSVLPWKESDQNGDNQLSRDEVTKDEWAFLEPADKDKNGQVTREEVEAHFRRSSSPRQSTSGEPSPTLGERIRSLNQTQRQELFEILREKMRLDPDMTPETRRALTIKALEEIGKTP